MNEVVINTTEIESVWEKDNVCFVKMKSSKVWLCELFIDVETCSFLGGSAIGGYTTKTMNYINSANGLIKLHLSKGKCDRNGK